MNRWYRTRRFNRSTNTYDTLFPQTVTSNILRRDDGGVLEEWLRLYDLHINANTPHLNHAVSQGNHRHLTVTRKNDTLADGYPLLLTLHTNLETDPTLAFNGGDAKRIVNGAGEPIPGGQCAGATLFLTYSAELDAWVSLSQDSFRDVIRVLMPSVTDFSYVAPEDGVSVIPVPGYDPDTDLLDVNYGQTILVFGTDYKYVRRENEENGYIELQDFSLMEGDILYFKITTYSATTTRTNVVFNLEMDQYNIKATLDDQRVFTLPPKLQKASYYDIIYGQTMLRNGIDYTIDDDGMHFTLNEFGVPMDDVLTIRAFRLVETQGKSTANNWGATGNYRYSFKVLYEEFTAVEDDVRLVPVPNFNHRRDELMVVRDNKVLVYDVDYTIDDLDQVELLRAGLDVGDTIYFTIRQGSMMDVPNFNVISASGDSGQHIHLDMSQDELCDYYTLLVKLSRDLENAPTAKCIDGPAIPILDCYGAPVQGGYRAGSYLWMVYNEDQNVWYSMSHSQYDVSGAYPEFEEASGEAYFTGNAAATVGDPNDLAETIVPHGLSLTPANIQITPIEPPVTSVNPYTEPDGTLRMNSTGDGVRWVQWMLFMHGFANTSRNMDDFVSGVYDTETYTSVVDWQTKYKLDADGVFDDDDLLVMRTFGTSVRTVVGDIWSYADETNLYIGNTGNARSKFKWYASTVVNNTDFKRALEEAVTELKHRPGVLDTRAVAFTAPADDVTTIAIDGYDPATDKIVIVNYGQTVLRDGIDYMLTGNGITLLRMALTKDDVIQFYIAKQAID